MLTDIKLMSATPALLNELEYTDDGEVYTYVESKAVSLFTPITASLIFICCFLCKGDCKVDADYK